MQEGSDRFGGLGGGCFCGADTAKRLENQVGVLIVTGENASHFTAPYLPTDYLKSLNKKSIWRSVRIAASGSEFLKWNFAVHWN